jgi:hypothetical protein
MKDPECGNPTREGLLALANVEFYSPLDHSPAACAGRAKSEAAARQEARPLLEALRRDKVWSESFGIGFDK